MTIKHTLSIFFAGALALVLTGFPATDAKASDVLKGAAIGAGVGALVDGSDGAKKGAVAGGIAGAILGD